MARFTNIDYEGKRKPYLLSDSLKVLSSYRIDIIFVSLLLLLSIFFFRDILENDTLLLYGEVGHGDLTYALTVEEHFHHHLDNLPIHAAKLPLLSALYPLQIILGDLLAVKVFTILILFLAVILVYFANKQFVSRFEGRRGHWLSASCFVGSLVVMYNPWTINEIHHHYWVVLSLAASYMLIAFIDSYIRSRERNNVSQFILIAFSTSLVATQPQGAIIYFLPMLIIYFLAHLIFHRPKLLTKYTAKKISILVIITIACNLFWLVPVIQALTADKISQGLGFLNYQVSQGFVTYGIVHENIDELSRRAMIENVLQGTSAWRWGGDNTTDQSIKINNIDLWEVLARLLPLSFIVLFFLNLWPIGKSIYVTVFFIALVIFSVILATGSYYNDIYKTLFLDFPLGESIRDPYKFSGLYFVAVSFFASSFLYRIGSISLIKRVSIVLLMLGMILSWGWVGLTGNLNGHLTESLPPYPHDLENVSEYLHNEYGISSNAKGKILWYPAAGERTQLQYSSVPELSTESLPNLKIPRFQLDYINHLIRNNDTSFISLLEYLGVQYLVIREDYYMGNDDLSPDDVSPTTPEDLRGRVQNIKTLLSENIVFESGRFGVYKLDTNSPVSVSEAISTGTDDLSKITKVAGESEYMNDLQLGPLLEDSLIVSDSFPSESTAEEITIIDPTSKHHLPEKYWSIGAINGGWLNTIAPYLNDFGINISQFDYNRGFIFTWGEKYLPSNFTLNNAQTLNAFDFNSIDEASQWRISHRNNQLAGIQSNTLIAVLNSSNFGWKTITSPALAVSVDRAYMVKLDIQYNNAEGVHLKVAEYDDNDVMLKSDIVELIGSGTSDWKDITFNYKPSSKDVTNIRLSVWHGHLTKQPLPNVVWIDSVRIYDVTDHLVENSIDIPFKVEGNNDNKYKLFVRYLESPEGGLINATLDGGSLMQINTSSPHSKLVWGDLGEYTLNPGSHTMTFYNGRGFNAINAILLIQRDQFEEMEGQTQDWLNRNNTRIFHIFETESDLNRSNTTIDNGSLLGSDNTILVNSSAWTEFDVKKDDDYKIWIKGSGTFTVVIDDQKEIVEASMDRPTTFSGSFRLKEGNSSLEVTPIQPLEKLKIRDYPSGSVLASSISSSKANDVTNVIDSIWLVSDNTNRLHDVDESRYNSTNQMQVITTISNNNNVWSPQEYEIELNNITTKRLMISLAEPFNPDLKAAIYTEDGLSNVENLIPLFYSLKSGIYIEEDSLIGDAKVVIYNTRSPLVWFAVGSVISLASYLLLLLSTNVRITNKFKGLICNLNRVMKHTLSQNKNNNKGHNS